MLSELLKSLQSARSVEELQSIEAQIEKLASDQNPVNPTPAESPVESQPNRWIVTTLIDVAAHFGAAVQTVRQWRSDPIPMPGDPGRFDLQEIARWYFKKNNTAASASGDPGKAADIRLKTASAIAKELENARNQGGLVSVEDVDRWAIEIFVELRETLMSLPEVLCTSVPESLRDSVRTESDQHVRDAIEVAQRKLSEHDYLNQTSEDPDEPKDEDPEE